jgi:tetratricopeptide (TPR) repeat protein
MLQSSINRRWYANALANAANIHRDLNHYELALEFYLQAEDIYRATGDLLGLSMAESNIGWLHFAQGDFKRAIEAINNAIRISQPLGLDPRNIANDLNLIGICHFEQGMYVTALSYFERYRELSHLHEIKSGYYLAILNMGNACLGMHQYPEARAAYVEAIGGLRKIGNLRWLTEPLTGLVEIEFEEDNATSARQYAEECLAVSETLKMPELVSNAHILLARCDAAEGNVAMATGKLEAMLAGGAETAPLQKLDEEQIADLHYWLWKISSKDRVERNGISLPDSGSEVPLRSTHFEEALARYEALHAKIPKFEFRKRIAELKGERVPMSADDLEDQPDVPVSEIPSVP